MDENLDLTKNIEINQALKDFEKKSQAEEMQKSPEVLKNSDVPKMVQLVMKWSGGAIKEQKQAEYILLGFVVVAMAVSLFLFFRGGNGGAGTSAIDIQNIDQSKYSNLK